MVEQWERDESSEGSNAVMNTKEEKIPRWLRRSGFALVKLSGHLGWRAERLVEVGVGMKFKEVLVFSELWNLKPDQIIAFEAHPGLFKRIKPEFPGKLIEVAVSDKQGTSVFFSKKCHKEGSSLYPLTEGRHCKEIVVNTNTLDNLMSGESDFLKGDSTLLWLDCEGNELKVLHGSEGFINHIDVVNVELTANPSHNDWSSPVDVHNWLREHGFYLQWLHTQRSDGGQSDGVYVKEHIYDPRFCCCPYSIQDWRANRCQTT